MAVNKNSKETADCTRRHEVSVFSKSFFPRTLALSRACRKDAKNPPWVFPNSKALICHVRTQKLFEQNSGHVKYITKRSSFPLPLFSHFHSFRLSGCLACFSYCPSAFLFIYLPLTLSNVYCFIYLLFLFPFFFCLFNLIF